MKTVAEILAIEGITLRLIPMTQTSLYTYREGVPLREGQEVVARGARQFVQEVKPLSLGGSWIVSINKGQGSMVQFNLKYDGVGATIEAAYADLVAKGRAQ